MLFLTNRPTRLSAALALTLGLGALASCNKSETVTLSQPPLVVGHAVDNSAPLSGAIKGTMKTGLIYQINGNVIIPQNDTLVIQPGVKVEFMGNFNFVVQGTFLSLGTASQPISITPNPVNFVHTDSQNADPALDPAYKGLWGGILGDVTCPLMVIKWTHIEGGGGTVVTSPVSAGVANNKNTYPILFQNPAGAFILEDSWMYGSTDDIIRVIGGRIHIMRNTFEKGGRTGGEDINIKSGTTGNIAYNLFVGAATNGSKASNNGNIQPQTNVYMYNNTYVNCGYRRSSAGRGGSINYEEGARGAYYNNVMINCKFGPRVVPNGNFAGNALIVADTAFLKYGNSFNYVDSLGLANQIYPTLFVTKPQATDIPTPASFLPHGYTLGMVYDGSSLLGQNNPRFVGFTLPEPIQHLNQVNTVGTSDFHLTSGSPLVGKGYTGFTALVTNAPIPVNPNYGATEITQPYRDLGAFGSDGTGNKH